MKGSFIFGPHRIIERGRGRLDRSSWRCCYSRGSSDRGPHARRQLPCGEWRRRTRFVHVSSAVPPAAACPALLAAPLRRAHAAPGCKIPLRGGLALRPHFQCRLADDGFPASRKLSWTPHSSQGRDHVPRQEPSSSRWTRERRRVSAAGVIAPVHAGGSLDRIPTGRLTITVTDRTRGRSVLECGLRGPQFAGDDGQYGLLAPVGPHRGGVVAGQCGWLGVTAGREECERLVSPRTDTKREWRVSVTVCGTL